MSRHKYTTKAYTIIVGWDNPLQTFFAQVWKGTEERGKLALWLGADPSKLVEIDHLVRELEPFGGLPEETKEALMWDYLIADLPTAQQEWMVNLLKSALRSVTG